MGQIKYLGSKNHKLASKKGGKIRASKMKQEAKNKIIEYNKNPKKCLQCGNPILHKTGKLGRTIRKKFCNHVCSANYSNSHRKYNPSEDKHTKGAICIKCGKKISINFRISLQNAKCNECGKKICRYCGQKKCLRPDICKRPQFINMLIKNFGFNESKIGTIEIYEEFDKIKNLLEKEYFDNKLSLLDLEKKYKYPHQSISQVLFKTLKLKSRNLSQANILAYSQGKNISHGANQYKCGWHTTWDNKQVFYRSSYELKYAEELDKQKVEYKMETLRILYWDTKLLRQRVAIPDFYLPKQNKIVEIKSPWTLDEQNMKDKEKAYKEHGYEFELKVD